MVQKATYMCQGAECALRRSQLNIRILEDNRTSFPSQFEQNRFQIFACGSSHDPPDCRAPCKSDLLHRRVLDQSRGYSGSILGPGYDHVKTAMGKTCFLQHGANGPVASRRSLRSLQHRRISCR